MLIQWSTRSSDTITVKDTKSFELSTSRSEESDTLKKMTSKLMAHILAKDNEFFCWLHLIRHELQMALDHPAQDLTGVIENIMNFISDSKTASQRHWELREELLAHFSKSFPGTAKYIDENLDSVEKKWMEKIDIMKKLTLMSDWSDEVITRHVKKTERELKKAADYTSKKRWILFPFCIHNTLVFEWGHSLLFLKRANVGDLLLALTSSSSGLLMLSLTEWASELALTSYHIQIASLCSLEMQAFTNTQFIV